MYTTPPKRLILKLGTQCNLGCAHCHQIQKNYREHPKLLQWIKDNKFERITFSGGEPLLYFNIIKKYMIELGKNITYRVVTNGTVIDDSMVDFFNNYNTVFAVSYDGEDSSRDSSLPIKWDTLKKLKQLGTSVVYSNPNKTFKEITDDIAKLGLPITDPELVKIGFVHQTKDAPNIMFTRKVAERYCDECLNQIEKALVLYEMHPKTYRRAFQTLINPWLRYRDYLGSDSILCCNRYLFNAGLDGTLYLCPYGGIEVGSIETGVNWNKIKSYIPERCHKCSCRKTCGCSCVANITEHECYIHKKMFERITELLKKYGIGII